MLPSVFPNGHTGARRLTTLLSAPKQKAANPAYSLLITTQAAHHDCRYF
jgi:hypothetical protein